jgi:hypothetical protein
MKHKKIYLLIFFLCLGIQLNGQNFDNKWTVAFGGGAAMYTNAAGEIVGGALTDQSFRVNFSRYFFNNFTLDAAFSLSLFDSQKYTSIDATVRYDFGTSNYNTVPYILVGTSIVDQIKSTPTLNFGFGNTFWLFQNYGLNFQLMYKYSANKYETQRSHLFPSVGFVYSFGPRNLNPRVWNSRR